MTRSMRRFWVVAAACALLLVAALVGGVGCCAAERRAARDLLPAWRTFSAASVPHPLYDEAGRAEWSRARAAIGRALARIAGAEPDLEDAEDAAGAR